MEEELSDKILPIGMFNAQQICGVLQKGTHVLRNPKLLSDLPQAPSETEDPSGPTQRESHRRFQVLMKRLQADIIDASDWDVISSPQADIMRSVLGGSTYQHALRAGSRKHLSLSCPHMPAISLAKYAPSQAHEAKSTLQHAAETCNLFEYLGRHCGMQHVDQSS